MGTKRDGLARARKAVGYSQEALAYTLNVVPTTVQRWESGASGPYPYQRPKLATVLGISRERLDELLDGVSPERLDDCETGDVVFHTPMRSREDLRTSLADTLATALPRDASVDDLEQQALQIGRATRFRSPGSLLLELEAQLGEIQRAIAASRSSRLSRRLARVAAQMSGLMSLSLLKLDDKTGSFNWVRTARMLAAETNDPHLQSWVVAQEAYYRFYDNDISGTVDVARYAQSLEAGRPGVGSALAAAVEARAHALLGQEQAAMQAVAQAESALASLAGDAVIPSAFGYNEAQLRFHQGNTLTRLGLVPEALQVQDRALELYPAEDFMDRALILLDRADCLTASGEVASAAQLATEAITHLESTQAQGLIANRARETLIALPPQERRHPSVTDLREVVESLQSTPGGVPEHDGRDD